MMDPTLNGHNTNSWDLSPSDWNIYRGFCSSAERTTASRQFQTKPIMKLSDL